MSRFGMSRVFVTICVLSSFCWASIPGWKSGEVSEELRKRLGQTKGSDPLIRPWDNPDLEYLLANDYRDYLESERAVASSKRPNQGEATAKLTATERATTESSLELTSEEISDSVIEEDEKNSSGENNRNEKVVKTSENTDTKSGNFTKVDEDYDDFMKDLLTINSTTTDQKSTNQQAGLSKGDELLSAEEAKSLMVNQTTPGKRTTLAPLTDLFSKAHTTGVTKEETPLNTEDCLPVSYRLKGIRSLIPPELLYELAKSPIGGYVLFGSNEFPLEEIKPKQEKAILANGLPSKVLLKEVLKLLPASIFIQTGEPGSFTSFLLKRGPVTAHSQPDQEPKPLNTTMLDNLKELEILRDKLKQIRVN
eukprot:TCALIF_01433-PA protein Name:"Protein of unknown function" AED:0.06 eAED:0.06 QI:81/0.8/1/1/0.6/0.66/6/39/364